MTPPVPTRPGPWRREQAAGEVAETVGRVNPTVGDAVSDTGKAVSDIVEGLGVKVDDTLGGGL